jgi:hypothetical protein
MSGIGTLSEKSLHAALKEQYCRAHDRAEVHVDGFIIDITRGDLLIEIQTRHFHLMKHKLAALLPNHPIRLVHPIPREKWIVRQTSKGEFVSRRKSPKRGRTIDIFYELVRIPHLLSHPNFSIELLLTQQDEIWRDDGKGSWRRKRWSVHDHRLLNVVRRVNFKSVADYCALLPVDLPEAFTNRDLAEALGCRLNLAQKMTYTLCAVEGIVIVGKRGNAHLHKKP